MKAAQLEVALRNCKAALQAARESCAKLVNTPAKSLNELDARAAAVNAASADLRRYSSAHQQVVALGSSPPDGEDDSVAICSANLEDINAATEKQRPALVEQEVKAAEARRRKQVQEKLASLRGEFLKLKRQRSALDSKLIGTLGGTAQSEVFAEYRIHLDRMIANRQQAVDLGDQTADLELSALQDDLRKLR